MSIDLPTGSRWRVRAGGRKRARVLVGVRAERSAAPRFRYRRRMSWSFHSAREFARFASTWDSLAAQCGNVPFLHSGFIAPLLAEFASGKEVLAAFAAEGGTEAMTLICPKGRGVWESFRPSQLPLAPWVQGTGAQLAPLSRSLLRQLPGFAIQVGLTQLDPRLFARPPDSGDLETLDYVPTASIPVIGSFDEYWNERGKNLRTNLRKQRRKLETEGMAVRFDVLTRAEDMAAAIDSYGGLETAGWKAALGTAIDANNAQGRFYRAMLENFCAAGTGRVYRYRFGERVVAVELCIASPDMLVVLKTTYEEGLGSLSPASLLREDEMRLIFREAEVRSIEFFGKVMDWHTQWAKDVRMLYHMNCFRWAWMARVKAYRGRKPRLHEKMPDNVSRGTEQPT
jgi:CelD/BcsL family acetyltransferase involved in cellulose biosynthesis